MARKNIFDPEVKYGAGTPQSQPISGREHEMVKNDAGGYVFKVDEEQVLKRFLVMGSDKGTYYVDPQTHNDRQRDQILSILNTNPELVKKVLVEERWKVPKLDNLMMLLAVGTVRHPDIFYHGTEGIIANLSNLYLFLKYRLPMKKLGSGARRFIKRVIESWQDIDYQTAKYRQREGVSIQDVLNLAHLPGEKMGEVYQAIFRYLIRTDSEKLSPEKTPFNYGRMLAHMHEEDLEEVLNIVRKFKLSREMVPTSALNTTEYWKTALEIGSVPYMAMLRNLRNMAKYGLLSSKKHRAMIEEMILEPVKAKAHPFKILLAQAAIGNSDLEYVDREYLVNLLEKAYLRSYDSNYVPKYRSVIGVDISGSMTWGSCVTGLDNMGLALSIAKVLRGYNDNSRVMAFSHTFRPIPDEVLSAPSYELTKELEKLHYNFGATDCSLPMRWAMENDIYTDVFIVLTDNETWYGSIHPVEALNQYRAKYNQDAKLVVIALEYSDRTIADPNDPHSLDLVGGSPDLVDVIDYFVQG